MGGAGTRWRGVRLVNSGFEEFGIQSAYGKASETDNLPLHRLPGVEQIITPQYVMYHDRFEGVADFRPYEPGLRATGLLRCLLEGLLGKPAHEWLRGRLTHAKLRRDGSSWRIRYTVDTDLAKARVSYVVDTAHDFSISGYEDYAIYKADHRSGYRRIVQVRDWLQLPGGGILPKRIVRFRFEYSPDTTNAWHSTQVITLLHADTEPAYAPMPIEWQLPLGTYVRDPMHALNSRNQRAGHWVGDLPSVPHATAPPPYDPALAKALDAQDYEEVGSL